MEDRNENEAKADNAEDQKSVKKEETTPAPANPPKEKADVAPVAKDAPNKFRDGDGLDLLSSLQFSPLTLSEPLANDQKGSIITGTSEVKVLYHDAKTVLELFQRGMGLNTGRSCLRVVEKTTEGIVNNEISYEHVWQTATKFARGIVELGINPGNDTPIGIQSINCPQRLSAEIGCFINNMVVVPFHRTFTEEWHQVEIAIAHRLPVLVVYDYENLDPYLDHIEKMQNLRLIVIIKSDTIPQDLMILADRCNVRLVWFEDVIDDKKRERILKAAPNKSNSESSPPSPVHPKPQDIAYVFLSHGTTAKPKCFSFTHEQVVAATMNLVLVVHCGGKMKNGSDILISDLYKSVPLGVMLEYVIYMHGSTVCYTRQTFHEYLEDLLSVQPSIVHIMPSSLERLHHIVVYRKKSPCAKWALRKTLENKMLALHEKRSVKRICLECMGSLRGGFPNSYKFTKIGLTSGDYVGIELMAFARSLFSCYFTQIYGTTETLGLGAHALPFYHGTFDAVGPPTPSTVIKIVPSDKLRAGPGAEFGLVTVKTPFSADSYQICVPTGDDATRPSLKLVKLPNSPFLETTDIGKWTKSGGLQLLGRLEDLVFVAGGFISLAKIESVFRDSMFVAQICVIGRKNETPLIALVYPDKEMLKAWAAKNKDTTTREQLDKELKIPNSDTDEIFQKRPNIEEIIMEDLKRLVEANDLPVGIRALRVSLQPFGPWYGQPRRYLMLELYANELNPIFDQYE